MGYTPLDYHTWGKSYKIIPKTTLVSQYVRLNKPKFYASYETDGSQPNMNCLLQNYYGRQWRYEHNAVINEERAKLKLKLKTLHDPLEKVKAIIKAKKEKEQKM